MMQEWKRFLAEEEGIGVVEVILILVVLIGLVITFKKEIGSLVDGIFSTIEKQTKKI